MKRAYRKRSYPLDEIRRFLEPDPIVLVSSAWQDTVNVMTMGWHMMLGFSPALFGCYNWDENHSYQMLRRYRGKGEFMVSSDTISRRSNFRPENL